MSDGYERDSLDTRVTLIEDVEAQASIGVYAHLSAGADIVCVQVLEAKVAGFEDCKLA